MSNRLKYLTLWIAGLVASSGTNLLAQNIVGTWQGTLQQTQGADRRLVAKVSRGENNALAATVYSVDPPGQPINTTGVSFQGGVFKMTLPGPGATYEGKLSADGNSLTGTLTQAQAGPLNFVRATPETAWEIPPPPAPPKQLDEAAVFEVATIKPSNPDATGQSILVGRGGPNWLTTTNTTLKALMIFAYSVHPSQLTGATGGWFDGEKYDITAKPDRDGTPGPTQLKTMMQKLLIERFGLVIHREKEISAYTINLAKGGHKLSKNDSGGLLPGFGGRGVGVIGARNTTMTEFADYLQARLFDRPVVDQTGLTGRFDLTLSWRPDESAPGPPAAPNAPPVDLESRSDIFTSFQEQLGLKLEATKTAVEVIVIDKVSKPSDN